MTNPTDAEGKVPQRYLDCMPHLHKSDQNRKDYEDGVQLWRKVINKWHFVNVEKMHDKSC